MGVKKMTPEEYKNMKDKIEEYEALKEKIRGLNYLISEIIPSNVSNIDIMDNKGYVNRVGIDFIIPLTKAIYETLQDQRDELAKEIREL